MHKQTYIILSLILITDKTLFEYTSPFNYKLVSKLGAHDNFIQKEKVFRYSYKF